MLDLQSVKYKYFNERDLEVPSVLNFVRSHPDIKTLLDVGAHYSWNHYATELKKLVPHYAGIDILPDEKTEKILDRYIVGNVLEKKLTPYDCVVCISTIEHSGISTYKTSDYKSEQLKVFSRLLQLSKKYIFITFPFGKEALHEGEFANIDRIQLTKFGQSLLGFKVKTNFYFSESPFVDRIPYQEVDIEFASNVEYLREKGTRCICILEIEK